MTRKQRRKLGTALGTAVARGDFLGIDEIRLAFVACVETLFQLHAGEPNQRPDDPQWSHVGGAMFQTTADGMRGTLEWLRVQIERSDPAGDPTHPVRFTLELADKVWEATRVEFLKEHGLAEPGPDVPPPAERQ